MSLTLNSNQNCFAVAVAVLAVLASAADAGMYESTYTLNTPYTASSPEVTHVLVNFSTSLTTGVVGQGDLTDWSISLYGAGGVIYTDSVIVGGSVQSIGGITRGIADVLFQFDLNTFVSGDFDNVLIGSGLSGATGTAYNITVPATLPINATASAGYSFSGWSRAGNCTLNSTTAASTTIYVFGAICNVSAAFTYNGDKGGGSPEPPAREEIQR